MIYRKRNLYYILFSLLVIFVSIILLFGSVSNNSSSAGKLAGRLNSSDISVSINNQLIPSYDFKGGVYMAAEDLQLFGFSVERSKNSVEITSPKSSSINREYLSNLSRIEEAEKVFYPNETVTLDDFKIVSYKTKDFTLVPINILSSLGECSKEANSTLIYCDLYN